MKALIAILLAVCMLPAAWQNAAAEETVMKMTLSEYQSRIRAAWLGKMVGVSVGRLIEFTHKDELISSQAAPKWHESLLSIAQAEDDVYLPYAMLLAMEEKGAAISGEEMAVSLYPYSFEFWNSHYAAFEKGIAPPYAGHPDNAPLPDALSYSFSADFTGLIAPGNPNVAIQLAQRFGSMLVYGDGIYGGAFIGAMNAEAFFGAGPEGLVKAGLAATPADCGVHQAVAQVLADWQRGLTFEACWEHVEQRWFRDPENNWIEWPGGRTTGIDLDAKLNCAYIAMSLLYGDGGIEKTLEIALRCGQDTDSNAANALCALFCSLGWENIPDTYKNPLRDTMKFAYVQQDFAGLLRVTEKVMREFCQLEETNGETYLLVARQTPQPPAHALSSKAPAPTEAAYFTPDQMARLQKPALQDGDFETDWHTEIYPPWIVIADRGYSGIDLAKGTAASGRNNAYLCPLPNAPMTLCQRRISVEKGRTYDFSCALSGSRSDLRVKLMVRDADGEKRTLAEEIFPLTSKYTTRTISFHTGEAARVDVFITVSTAQQNAWSRIDQVTLEKQQN